MALKRFNLLISLHSHSNPVTCAVGIKQIAHLTCHGVHSIVTPGAAKQKF